MMSIIGLVLLLLVCTI